MSTFWEALDSETNEDFKDFRLFNAKASEGHITPPKKRWAALIGRAGLTNLHLHDLRRSLGSWQARTGASPLIIGKSLGHKSMQATQIYARLDADPVREAVTHATTAMLFQAPGSFLVGIRSRSPGSILVGRDYS
jgi:integrase